MKKYRLALTTAALLMAFTLNTGKAKAAENDNNLKVPSWAIKLVLQKDEI